VKAEELHSQQIICGSRPVVQATEKEQLPPKSNATKELGWGVLRLLRLDQTSQWGLQPLVCVAASIVGRLIEEELNCESSVKTKRWVQGSLVRPSKLNRRGCTTLCKHMSSRAVEEAEKRGSVGIYM
jgi:hypothetical protein